MNFSSKKIFFTTVTINNWVPIFQEFPETNGIILSSFQYCASNWNVKFYAFVIMRDHIHFIWQCPSKMEAPDVISKFKQHTGRNISHLLKTVNSNYLDNFISERKDRDHKIWKLETSNLRIEHPDILHQKINYIHLNPIQGNYKSVDQPEAYLFSSARAYMTSTINFTFLTLIA